MTRRTSGITVESITTGSGCESTQLRVHWARDKPPCRSSDMLAHERLLSWISVVSG